MDETMLLDFMSLCEKLKCTTRHSWTSDGRHESVAEHSWRLCVFAWLMKEKIREVDIERVIMLCLFHDLGEAVTGDIPCFEKGEKECRREDRALETVVDMLPGEYRDELEDIFKEISENQTKEAKLFHALDKMEALIQHNEAPIGTWLPLEYDLQLTYGTEQAEVFSFTRALRDRIKQDSLSKMEHEKNESGVDDQR